MTALVDLCADDALRSQADGLGLHALHRQFAGIVEGLGIIGHLHVLADLLEPLPHALVRNMVDAVAHDHTYRTVPGAQYSPKILPGEVRGQPPTTAIPTGLAPG